MKSDKAIVTVTSKRMITIPAKFARRYGIKNSTKIEIIDTDKGLLLIPIVPLEVLFGVDNEETTRKIVEEIHKSRRADVELED